MATMVMWTRLSVMSNIHCPSCFVNSSEYGVSMKAAFSIDICYLKLCSSELNTLSYLSSIQLCIWDQDKCISQWLWPNVVHFISSSSTLHATLFWRPHTICVPRLQKLCQMWRIIIIHPQNSSLCGLEIQTEFQNHNHNHTTHMSLFWTLANSVEGMVGRISSLPEGWKDRQPSRRWVIHQLKCLAVGSTKSEFWIWVPKDRRDQIFRWYFRCVLWHAKFPICPRK
jgi:hypothetical protein